MWRRAWTHAGESALAWVGLGVCSVVVVGWAVAAGLALEVAIPPHFLVLGCFVLVHARIRAETGVPLEFIYPWAAQGDGVECARCPASLAWGACGAW